MLLLHCDIAVFFVGEFFCATVPLGFVPRQFLYSKNHLHDKTFMGSVSNGKISVPQNIYIYNITYMYIMYIYMAKFCHLDD